MTTTAAQEASQKVTELRAAYNAATVGSKQWREIAEDLAWWIGRKAEVSR